MSSDDNKTPHSGKRKKFVKSESEDSDGSIVQSYRRKKTFKFVSDGESSDEDSDIQTSTVWKQKRKVVIEDDSSLDSSTSGKSRCEQFGESSDSSEWQSDWSSSSEIDTRSPMKRKHVSKSPKKTPKIVSDTDTDSNDEQLEKCPICLLPFKRQQLATPAACEHCFCLECLIEWSKNTNTCPVDRQLFTIIHVRDKVGGQVVNSVPVQVAPREEESLDDLTFCEVCHQSDREDRMLLCDGCDCGYHLECLTPPLTEVPLDQWFCPECSLNSQGDAEVVEIDMDEISDLMEEARRLGVSYGRTRANLPTDAYPRVIPRTRHTERVRATIRRRSRMNSDPSLTHQLTIDPNQPSTSSGLESYGDNSRSRSPSNASNSLGNGEQNCSSRNLRKRSRKHGSSSSESSDESVSREYVRNVGRKSNSSGSQRNKTRKKRGGTKKGKGSSSRKKDGGSKSKKSGRSRKVSGKGTILKKVTITECNENGEEEEIVTYVKVTANSSRRKRRRRRKRRHRARTVSSVLATTKKRLASAIGICKPDKGIPALIPSVRNRTIISDRSLNTIVRRNAGIPRLSLLGDGLNLDYSPPGSDTEDYRSSIGPGVAIQRHSVISARRRVRLKNISAPQQPRTDLLSSIINDQEVWHSKSSSVTLKANGTLLIEKKENVGKSDEPTEKLSSTPGEIESVGDDRVSTVDVPMEVSRINPESITQAPMYNNPCGGGNRGNFRGGYRDNTRHSHGGQNYARDSLSGSGRHRYSGNSGNFGRDFGPPGFYNPNFDHCGPPMFGGNPPFRNRNPQHFRNDRFRFTPSGRPQFNFGENVNEHHPHREQFNPSRSPHVHFDCPQNNMPPNLPEDTLRVDAVEQQPQDGEGTSVRQEEDCDIYCDIETKSDGELQDQQNGSMTLLPPPEPPSGLLDFEENSRSDKDSDQELVIDDSRKEDAPRNDKYDPFSVDSDSDSDTRKNEESSEKKREELPGKITVQAETSNTSVPLLVYDDEDEEDSRSDCPNFSIYSSTTIDVARRTEQQLSQQIGPLEPPPLPPSIPDDDDVIVGDVQACDLTDIPEPSDPYVEALRKERRTLSKIPSKKISHDSRGKITFKIGTKLKINNRLLGLQEEEDDEDSENEKKKEFECVKEEDVPVDREEERKRIARSKFEEMEEKENHMDEQEEVSVVTCEDLLNVEEKDIKDDKKDEECIEICKDKITMQKNIDTAASLPVTEQASSVTLENELTDECLAENESETSESFRKTSTIHISQGNNERDKEQSELTVDVEKEDDKDDEQMEEEEEEEEEEDDDEEEEEETFPIEKEKLDEKIISDKDLDKIAWESDGAYTPCKDERPLKESSSPSGHLPPIESGLEPITPTKDKPDDLDGCRTPVDYNVLGTEAISETDEAMNFEDELNVVTSRKEKEMEDGEIVDEKCTKDGEKIDKEKEDEKKRKKKEKKEKSNKETEKNKENIASENQVAWKKLSKSTKERSYRDKEKRSKSKEKEKEKPKKKKETVKKKEKRKELPRYDVRKVVAERPSRPRKDEYGRDIREKSRQRSRSRSLSSSKRSRSYSKLRSRSRSRTRLQRSWSRDRRSYSKSPSRRRSLSRGRRKSPKRRSASRKRSVSRRSLSRRRRSLSRRRSKRSMSRSRRSLSRSRQRRSRSRSRRSLSRSRDRRKDKKKYKSRSRSRNRKKSRSKSPRRSSKSRERKHSKRKVQSRSRSKGRSCSRNWDQVEKTVEHDFSREREERESWSAQWTPSWSRSISKTPQHVQQEQIAPREWSPMLDNVSFPPKNLTVILTNKEAIKKKKKERRKENKKAKDEKKRKGKRNRTPPPSKEIFTSGDNILVSVCFKKDNENDQAGVPELAESLPLVPPLKRRRRESLQVDPPKRSKKEKSKDKRSKSPKPKKDKKKKSKAAEIAATKKPVAVIDLDQSPFREQTPSPRDVIVLSDDDDKQIQQIATDQCQPPENSPPREQFVSQGPKTPPEPQIKFSINKQTSNLRPSMLNPLLDEEEEEEEEEMDERVEEELEMRAQEELELRLKIGPNTPPEPPTSPPTSPDAYDPFDPTKSRSPTPDVSQEANSNDERRRSPRKHESGDGNLLEEENMQTQERQSQEKQLLDKPKIISMVTIKRASPQREDVNENDSNKDSTISTGNLEVQQNQQNVQNQNNPFAAMNPVLATVAAAVQRSGVFNTPNSNSNQRNMLPSNRISPSNQQKQRSADRSQAPAVFTNSGKPSRGSKSGQTKSNGQNGNDPGGDTGDNVDMSSPYSPGSTLSDGIFDPPSPTNFNNSPPPGPTTGPGPVAPPTAKTSNSKTVKSSEKKDAFDNLFSTLPASKTASKSTRSKKPEKDKKRKSTNPKVGVRMDENQLQILDDLPSSAVEMQVKDKFLKKLNRQERVVEEVKLVLKPHYTKKHVTKEEYKDIMRKAVPKICHNKTGEINPKKIAHLIEAYVKKCRTSKKKTTESSSVKASKPVKSLWS